MAVITLRVTITMDEEQIRRYADARGLSTADSDDTVALGDVAADLRHYVQDRLGEAALFAEDVQRGPGAKVAVNLPHRDHYENGTATDGPDTGHRARRHRP